MAGCGLSQQELSEAVTEATSLETTSAVMESDEADTTSETYSVSEERKEENVPLTYTDVVPEFSDLSDENLLKYVEDNIYSGIVDELNSDDYFVEEVSAVYVSKEKTMVNTDQYIQDCKIAKKIEEIIKNVCEIS